MLGEEGLFCRPGVPTPPPVEYYQSMACDRPGQSEIGHYSEPTAIPTWHVHEEVGMLLTSVNFMATWRYYVINDTRNPTLHVYETAGKGVTRLGVAPTLDQQ